MAADLTPYEGDLEPDEDYEVNAAPREIPVVLLDPGA